MLCKSTLGLCEIVNFLYCFRVDNVGQKRLVVHIFTWAEKIAGREIELVMSKEKGNAIISSDSGHSNIKVAMRKKSPSAHNKETKILCSSTTGTVHRVCYWVEPGLLLSRWVVSYSRSLEFCSVPGLQMQSIVLTPFHRKISAMTDRQTDRQVTTPYRYISSD